MLVSGETAETLAWVEVLKSQLPTQGSGLQHPLTLTV